VSVNLYGLQSTQLKSYRLVPVEVFGTYGDGGYGLMDAVPAWSDCDGAIGRVYRIDDIDPAHREDGDTLEIFAGPEAELFFARKFGDG
jgi:hypothetical protein